MKMNKKIGSLISLGFLLGGVATSIPLISTSCGENPKDRTDINTIITQLKLGYVPIKDPQIILNAIKDVNPKASNLTLNTDVSITSIDAGRAIVLGIGQYRGEVVVTFSSNPSIAP
ncbi:hypothetical protein FACS1894166_01040 [Bacilli bacterium]|nr:hypothetical protein FACS1894166_01040 [Bacilli bacterium]